MNWPPSFNAEFFRGANGELTVLYEELQSALWFCWKATEELACGGIHYPLLFPKSWFSLRKSSGSIVIC